MNSNTFQNTLTLVDVNKSFNLSKVENLIWKINSVIYIYFGKDGNCDSKKVI